MLCGLALLVPTGSVAQADGTDVPVILSTGQPPVPPDVLSVDTSTTTWVVAYWTRDGVEIPYSVNDATYEVELPDLGTQLAVVASDDGGTTEVTSAPVTVPHGPHITVTVTGQQGNLIGEGGNTDRWYTSWPTVTSTCTPGDSPIVYCSPSFVEHDTDGCCDKVVRYVTDQYGITRTQKVYLSVDTVAPEVRLRTRWANSQGPLYLHDGLTYLMRIPQLHCDVIDENPGLCPIRTPGTGVNRTVTATGSDEAGNTTTQVVHVHVCRRCIFGSRYAAGRWRVRRGAIYVVKIVSPVHPAVVGFARPGHLLTHRPLPMRRAAAVYGQRVWSARVRMPSGRGRWQLVIRVGGHTTRMPLTVR